MSAGLTPEVSLSGAADGKAGAERPMFERDFRPIPIATGAADSAASGGMASGRRANPTADS